MAMDAADASLLDSVTAGSSKIIAGSDKVAILMALVAALAPLDFGMTLGFTSPAIIGMESGEKGSWMYGAVFDDAEVQSDHSIVSSQAALFGSMVNGAPASPCRPPQPQPRAPHPSACRRPPPAQLAPCSARSSPARSPTRPAASWP